MWSRDLQFGPPESQNTRKKKFHFNNWNRQDLFYFK